jgi:hypothetical protein
MIANHTNVISAILLIVAVVAFLYEIKYSPIRFDTEIMIGDYDKDRFMNFKLLFAIRWACVGAAIGIEAMRWW